MKDFAPALLLLLSALLRSLRNVLSSNRAKRHDWDVMLSQCYSAEPLVPELGLLEGSYDTFGLVDAPAVRAAFSSGAVQGVLGGVITTMAGKRLRLKGSGRVIEVRR